MLYGEIMLVSIARIVWKPPGQNAEVLVLNRALHITGLISFELLLLSVIHGDKKWEYSGASHLLFIDT